MSTESKSNADTAPPQDDTPGRPDHIYLVSYPKIIFLYPSLLMAIIAGTVMSFLVDKDPTTQSNVQVGFTMSFLVVLAINMVVLSFDFPRTTSLTLFFLFATLTLGSVLLFTFYPDLLPSFLGVLKSLKPVANPTFFWIFAGTLGLIYVVVLISVQFDYWEVRPNELLHHHGFLSNLERFPSPNLRVEKEISDIFEYMLLRSGTLILTPEDAPRPIVLENVLFISSKEDALTSMLGALHVHVRGKT